VHAVAEWVEEGPFNVGAEGFGAEVRVAEGAGGGEMREDLVRRLVCMEWIKSSRDSNSNLLVEMARLARYSG
jgi:hypothetical protein